MDITDSIFEDSLSNGGNNDFMEGGEPLSTNFPFPLQSLQFQLPDLPFPDDFLDLAPRPQAMPVINPFSVRENFINEQVVTEIEMERPSALTAEEIVDGYLPTRDTNDQFSRLHVLVCGLCHSVFHVVDEFNSHLRKCSGVKTNSSCSDQSESALALVLWSNTIHRKLKPSLAHLSGSDSLANTIQQKWFRLSKKTKLVWITAARTLQQLGKAGKLVFPGPDSGSSAGHGWPETWRSPVDLGEEDEIQQEMVFVDSIKKEVIELDVIEETVNQNEVQPMEAVRTSSRKRKGLKRSSNISDHPEFVNPRTLKKPLKAPRPWKVDKREKWKKTKRNSRGLWLKDNTEDSTLRCDTCLFETKVGSKMKRHMVSVKHKRLVASKDELVENLAAIALKHFEEDAKKEDVENISNLVLSKDETEDREKFEGETNLDNVEDETVENLGKLVSDKSVEKENCDKESNSDDVENVRILVEGRDETVGNCEEGSNLDGVENILEAVEDSELMENKQIDITETENSSMNVATPPCNISPISVTPDSDNSPVKKKKFKLFNHQMKGIVSLSQDSNEKLINKSKYKDPTTESLKTNSSCRTSSVKSALMIEKTVNIVGDIAKHDGQAKKLKTVRVDPVLKDKPVKRVSSKRKSAIAAKGKVSSWAQGHCIEDSVKVKRKGALEVSAKAERKGVVKNFVQQERKSPVVDFDQGNKNITIKDFPHVKRIDSSIREESKSAIKNSLHGKRKSAIAAQGKVSCWALGQSLDQLQTESPIKKFKAASKSNLHMSKNAPYIRTSIAKLNKMSMSSVKKSDLPKITVEKVKIDDGTLKKLQLERQNGKLKVEEMVNNCIHKELFNETVKENLTQCDSRDAISSTTIEDITSSSAKAALKQTSHSLEVNNQDMSFDCVGGRLPLPSRPIRDEIVLNSTNESESRTQDRSRTFVAKRGSDGKGPIVDAAKIDKPISGESDKPGELQLSVFFHFQTTTPGESDAKCNISDEMEATTLAPHSQDKQKSSLILTEESQSSRNLPLSTTTTISSSSSIGLETSSSSQTSTINVHTLHEPSTSSSSIVIETSSSSQNKPPTQKTLDTRPKPTVLGHRRPSFGHQEKIETEKIIQLGGEGPSSLAQATGQLRGQSPAIVAQSNVHLGGQGPSNLAQSTVQLGGKGPSNLAQSTAQSGLAGPAKKSNKFQPPIVAKKSAPPREPGELSMASLLKDPHLRVKTRVPTTAQTVHQKYAYHQGIGLLKPEVIVASKPAKTIVGTVRTNTMVEDEARSLAACLPKGFEMVKQQTEGKTEFCLIKKPQFPITANVNHVKTIKLGEQQSSISTSRRIGILQHQTKPSSSGTSQLPSQPYVPSTSTSSVLEKRLGQRVEGINPGSFGFKGKKNNVCSQAKQPSQEANNLEMSFDAVGGRLPLTNQPMRDEIRLLEQETYTKHLPNQNKLIFIESPAAFHKSIEAMALSNSKTSSKLSSGAIPVKPSATVIKRIQNLGPQQFNDGGTSKMLIELPGGNKMVADLTKDQLKDLNISFNQADDCLGQLLVPEKNVQNERRPQVMAALSSSQPPNVPALPSQTVSLTPYQDSPDLSDFSSHQLFESAMKEPPVVGPVYYQPTSPKGGNKEKDMS